MNLHQDELTVVETLDNNLEFSKEDQVKKANDLGLASKILEGNKTVFSLLNTTKNTLKGVFSVVESNSVFYLEDVLLVSDISLKTVVVRLLDVLFRQCNAKKVVLYIQYDERTVQSDLQALGFGNKTIQIEQDKENEMVQAFEISKDEYYI
jgi:hypothetical protein